MKRRILTATLLLAVMAAIFAQSSAAVYVTAKGKKYHMQYCRTIKKSAVTAMTKTEAQKAGYTPCKVCNP